MLFLDPLRVWPVRQTAARAGEWLRLLAAWGTLVLPASVKEAVRAALFFSGNMSSRHSDVLCTTALPFVHSVPARGTVAATGCLAMT